MYKVFFVCAGGLIAFLISACAKTDSDTFFYGALGLGEGRILVANSVATPPAHTVSMYTLSGEYLGVVSDTSQAGKLIRGLAPLDAFNIVMATDTPDELVSLNLLSGQLLPYAQNGLFTGNIFQVVRQSEGVYLAIESNNIEKFVNGQRTPAIGNAYIATPLGGCTINVARGLAINQAGELLVTSFTGGSILRYDISGSVATCLQSRASVGGQPLPIVSHPNGNAYFGAQTTDLIYEVDEALAGTPTAITVAGPDINNPSAMAVLPNGNLLVASDGTDAISEIDTSGNIVNALFIENAFTTSVVDIFIIQPD